MDSIAHSTIAAIHQQAYFNGFIKEANLVQCGRDDFMNALQVERGISLEHAFEIAQSNPLIDYFFYVKAPYFFLPGARVAPFDLYQYIPDDHGGVVYWGLPSNKDPFHLARYEHRVGLYRSFCRGDAVFFSCQGKYLADSMGGADVYSKMPVQEGFYQEIDTSGFQREENLVEAADSDFSHALRVERHISLEKALEIARKDPEIDYFFYVKARYLFLSTGKPNLCRRCNPIEQDSLRLISYEAFHPYGQGRAFWYGDAVFFGKKTERRLDNSNHCADIYLKLD